VVKLTALILIAGGILLAQGPSDSLPAREKPSEYQASVALPAKRTLASDYLGHSAPTPRGILFAPNHLVVEVAIFGSGPVNLNTAHFQLQLTGGRGTPQSPLHPDPSTIVASSMREGSMYNQGRSRVEMGGGIGNSGVLIGRRPQTTGIPDIDAQRPGRGSDPPVVGAPGHDRSGNPAENQVDPAHALADVEIINGERRVPVRGLLFFPYAGKLKSLKTITLHYQPDPNAPAATLSLLP
jgi:hypothetical protein